MAGAHNWVDDVETLLRSRFAVGVTFTTMEAYSIVPDLLRTHPNARNPQARVRDALQGLRLRRSVEFLAKRGTYRLRPVSS